MTQLMTRFLKYSALAGVLSVGCMQGAVQAHFHLPMTAHWGDSVLTPGDYRIVVPDSFDGMRELTVEGNGCKMFQIVRAVDQESKPVTPSLMLVERNGAYYVKEYRSDIAGKTFSFGVPKQKGVQPTQIIDSTR